MSKIKTNTKKSPDPSSIRSKKRAARGFKTCELSTRKGKRNASRISIACNINGTTLNPGDKVLDNSHAKMSSFMQTAGGGNNFH